MIASRLLERDQQALEDVRARLLLGELVLGAAHDHLALVSDVVVDHLAQVQRARDVVDERDHVHAERGLHRRVLVELVEHDLRDRVALELDHQAHAALVGLVAQVGDLGDPLVVDEFGDLRRSGRLSPPFLTMKGSSVTTIASLPWLSGSMWARACTRTRPRPVS